MNIVITGATSFIGTAIINKLIEIEENKVWAIIRPGSPNKSKLPKSRRITVIELDMGQIEQLDTYIQEPIDVFFHLAWEGVRAPFRDDEKIQKQNLDAAIKAVAASSALGCRKFIGCGSQAEYGIMQGAVTEEYTCCPQTAYGRAKFRACQEIQNYAGEHHMNFIWGRVFSVYGPGDFEGSLIMSCVDKMRRHEEIPLTECVQQWDYLYIDEAAEIFFEFAQKQCRDGIYNIASGNHQELREFVETIKRVMQSDSELLYGKIAYPKQGMVSFIPVIKKMQQEIGWQSKITFKEGIRRILKDESNEKN